MEEQIEKLEGEFKHKLKEASEKLIEAQSDIKTKDKYID